MRRASLFLALSTLTSLGALADEGEAGLALAAGIEGATLRHPWGSAPAHGEATLAPVLSVSAGGRQGLSNWLDGGLSLEMAFAINVTTPSVSVKGANGTLITGMVFEARLPLAVEGHLDLGLPVSVGLGIEAGPVIAYWRGNALVDPSRMDRAGLPTRLPVEVADELAAGAFVRLRLSLPVRPFDELAFDVKPYLSVSWTAAPAIAAGVAIDIAWLPAIWPL